MAQDTSYSREDVQKEIRETAFDAFNRYPSFSLPGVTMLAGGLLLAFTRKRLPHKEFSTASRAGRKERIQGD